jgi:hypothetical protein
MRAIVLGALAAREEQREFYGRSIQVLYCYDVLVENSGTVAFRDLPITIDLVWPGRRSPPTGSEAECMIEEPNIDAPLGGSFANLHHQEDPPSVRGTCDLLNPRDRLEVRFFTHGPSFVKAEPEVRVVARAEKLPPPILCKWPGPGKGQLLPTEPEHDYQPRGWIREKAARLLGRLGRALNKAATWLGSTRVVRHDPK